jgi:multidrug efflux pump subunit AcrB
MNWSAIRSTEIPFRLILVLGIVVDDAIIIVENSYRHYQMGKSIRTRRWTELTRCRFPCSSATLTTVAASCR